MRLSGSNPRTESKLALELREFREEQEKINEALEEVSDEEPTLES